MSWNNRGVLDFWILTGKAPANSSSVFIPTHNIGLDKPHKFRLVDLFQINISQKDDLENKLRAINAVDAATASNEQGEVNLSLELIQKPAASDTTVKTKTSFSLPTPYLLKTQDIASKCKSKTARLKSTWRGHALAPSLLFNENERTFKLVIPPNTRLYAHTKLFWSLFGMVNAAIDVRTDDEKPEEVAPPLPSTSGSQQPPNKKSQLDYSVVGGDTSSDEDDEYIPPTYVPPPTQRQNLPRKSKTNLTEDEQADFDNKRFKRSIETNPLYGFINESKKARIVVGAKREVNDQAWTYLLTQYQEKSKAVTQAKFFIESLVDEIPQEEEAVTSDKVEVTVDDPFDKNKVQAALKGMLETALLRLNLRPSTLFLTRDPQTEKLVFVSGLNRTPMRPSTLVLKLNDLLQKITGLREELQFEINPGQPSDHYFRDIEPHFISEPTVAKVFKDNENLVALPAATSVILLTNSTGNTIYSNLESSSLLCYITSDKKIISSDTFLFKGHNNLISCTFFNEQAQAPLVWERETHFKFIFKNVGVGGASPNYSN
jgi:hypothetical protein